MAGAPVAVVALGQVRPCRQALSAFLSWALPRGCTASARLAISVLASSNLLWGPHVVAGSAEVVVPGRSRPCSLRCLAARCFGVCRWRAVRAISASLWIALRGSYVSTFSLRSNGAFPSRILRAVLCRPDSPSGSVRERFSLRSRRAFDRSRCVVACAWLLGRLVWWRRDACVCVSAQLGC